MEENEFNKYIEKVIRGQRPAICGMGLFDEQIDKITEEAKKHITDMNKHQVKEYIESLEVRRY